ncbi:MAG TPA: AraC family transcriptional regulator, partial [Thermomicrobiales bacterium]|nr:AraC family transcriptional regulator [Thermomicrobiales bacterium]
MDVVSRPEVGQEGSATPALHQELVERVARSVPENGTAEPLEGLVLRRATAPTEVGHGLAHPSFCVIAQGSKEVRLGDRRYRYDPAHYLIATTAVPVASRITEASPERPYLGIVLRLDPALVASVMVEAGRPAPRGQSEMAIDVSPLDAGL